MRVVSCQLLEMKTCSSEYSRDLGDEAREGHSKKMLGGRREMMEG